MRMGIVALVTALVLASWGCDRTDESQAPPDEVQPFVPAPEGEPEPVPAEAAGHVSVSFVVDKFPVQTALWVEGADGGYLRTLHVSRWEAQAGHARAILPLWVEASEEARGAEPGEAIDAVTMATFAVAAQPVTFAWDLRDWRGEQVAAGSYVISLQCDGKRGVITWRGTIVVGDEPAQATAVPEPALADDGSNAYVKDVEIAFAPE